ncbi:hypothetical protein PAXY110619_13260 [Paenibacillus xylanexedens]|uniref:Uncharacterized protein n=1 Tax=Paenibacillus xylanexedens TaxID=528191 RepID=A0ABS4RZ22_PAEXY|nr:hypothetical protein [Paenibacillus xylanexedens]
MIKTIKIERKKPPTESAEVIIRCSLLEVLNFVPHFPLL